MPIFTENQCKISESMRVSYLVGSSVAAMSDTLERYLAAPPSGCLQHSIDTSANTVSHKDGSIQRLRTG